MIERIDPAFQRLRVLINEQLHARLLRHPVAQGIHVLELPGRVDVEQREGRRRRVEGLARKVQHHGRILAHRIEHHRLFCLGDHLTHDVDAFGLKPFKMGQDFGHAAPLPAIVPRAR